MKKIVLILFMGSIFIHSFVFGSELRPVQKIGCNVLSLIAFSDVNLFYETNINQYVSQLYGFHYFTSGTFQDWKTDFRFSAAVRIYAEPSFQGFGFLNANVSDQSSNSKTSLMGYFMEGRATVTRLDGEFTPTIEFGMGYANALNAFTFYEWKLGLARFFNSKDTVLPVVSFSVGFY